MSILSNAASIVRAATDAVRNAAAATQTVKESTEAVHVGVKTVREQITATEAALRDAKGMLIPRRELVDRFCQTVDERAARFARVPPHGQTWPHAATMFRSLGEWQAPKPLDIRTVSDLVDLLCFFAGDALKAGAPRLLTMDGWSDGLPASERPEVITGLERSLAELEALDERLIDEAAAGGVALAHRPEVVQRRELERRRRESAERANAEQQRHEREAAVDAHHERRVSHSEYLERH